jgi:HK97 family phage portal protein
MADEVELQKSSVTLPPPGMTSRWAILGNRIDNKDIPYPDKSQQYAVYYEMYRQHPVVRSAVDKKAHYAVSAGYRFTAREVGGDYPPQKERFLKELFRASNARNLLSMTYKDLDIYGESFWLVILNLNDVPMRLVRLHPRFMTPVIVDGEIVQWRYGPTPNTDDALKYEPRFVMHFAISDPEDDTRGLSPLHPLQRTVAQDIFAMEYNESFFTNAAQTGTIFIVKTSNEEEAARNRVWLEQNYTGAHNAHRPILLEGDVTVEKSVSSSQEMEFLEGRMLLRQEIAMALEVDLEKLGVHLNSNRSVAREVEEAFKSESIWTRQQIVEDEINSSFFVDLLGWHDIVFSHAEADPRRKQDQADTDDKNLKSGRETINVQRERLGLPQVEGGDEAFIMSPTGIIFVRNFPALAEMQAKTNLPVLAAGGYGTDDVVNQLKGRESEPLTRIEAEAVSQNDPR